MPGGAAGARDTGSGAQPEDRRGYPPQGAEQPGGQYLLYAGTYMPDAGSSFTHVEHIMAITSLRSCYEAIECMKNGETLIVTLDVLGSEGERIRCQDMLAGAAFTLGCSVRTLPQRGRGGDRALRREDPAGAAAADAMTAGDLRRLQRASRGSPFGIYPPAGTAGEPEPGGLGPGCPGGSPGD